MRWIFRLLGLVVVLVAVAIGTLFLIPTDRIGAIVSDQFAECFGLVFRCERDIVGAANRRVQSVAAAIFRCARRLR